MNLSTPNLNKSPSSYDQTLADLIKWTLLNPPEKYSHASQFTKHISLMTLEGNILLKIQKLRDDILSAFCLSLSTIKSCSPYKYLRAENHNIYYLLLPPDTHHKFSTAKEIYEALSRALRVYIVEGNTISSSKEPTS